MVSTDGSMMVDSEQTHKRQQDYSYRLPTPPRIVVPPPTLTTDIPELSMGMAPPDLDADIDTSFLKEFSLESIVQKNTLLNWAYERRRQAQMILPWLYLGPLTSAKDSEALARDGITMILAIRSRENSMNGPLQSGRQLGLEVATIEAPNFFDLIGNFPRTTKIINRHVGLVRQMTANSADPRLGKVLVFCESGNEKSAAVVAAYLMEMLDEFDHVKAMQICQAQRFCVNYDDTVKNILRSYWDILQARRAVAGARANTLPSPNELPGVVQSSPHNTTALPKPKRMIEDTMDDGDVDMGSGLDPSDVLRFQGRANTPFQDT